MREVEIVNVTDMAVEVAVNIVMISGVKLALINVVINGIVLSLFA